MHGRRSVAQKISEDLHSMRDELSFRDRIDAVSRERSRFTVGDDVFADHLIALKSDDEFYAAAEINSTIESMTTAARQLLGSHDDVVWRQLAAGAIELRLDTRLKRAPLGRRLSVIERDLGGRDELVAGRIALRHQKFVRQMHAQQIQIFDRERRHGLDELRAKRARLRRRDAAVEEQSERLVLENIGNESQRAS